MLLLQTGIAEAGYSRSGEYLGLGGVVYPSTFHIQPDGSVVVDYGGFEAINPTTTAQVGLSRHGVWVRTGDRRALADARRAARWLVRAQAPDGGWRYEFPWQVADVELLQPGWMSAIAQGQAISLLTRLHVVTGRRAFLRAARRAVRPFRIGVRRGGVRRRAFGGPWFEEYPTTAGPSLVLNGAMFGLLGLYDVAPYNRAAARLFERGMDVLGGALPAYDLPGGWSLYAIATEHGRPWVAPVPYHRWHVTLLRVLDSLRPDRRLRVFADRWAAGLPT
jgi:D-glucuronyl C5-epimerase C-terminus